MKTHPVLIAALLTATSVFSYAQTQQEHESHHPNAPAESESAPAPASPAQPQSGAYARGGMMHGKGSMMNMMGDQMPMMGMMQMMTGHGGGMGGMDGMVAIDRVEGRIAFLKTELKITDGQSGLWNVFADSLRSNARTLGELRSAMNPQGSLVDRLAWQEKWLSARVDGTRAIRVAFIDLAAKLDDEQKTNAEQLLVPHMGMMAMMSGMDGAPMMGAGGMGMGGGQKSIMPASPMTKGSAPQKR